MKITNEPIDLEKHASELAALIRQVRLAYYQLNQIFLISGLNIKGNSGAYGILADLNRLGPQSIPALLQERAVSRQSIHRMIKSLESQELVEYIDNPKHKSSKLISLTDKGTLYYLDRAKIVNAVISEVSQDLSRNDVRAAMKTMLSIRDGFDAFIAKTKGSKN